MGELVCGVVAGCLLAASPPLTLDGRELSPVVEVWRPQEPAAPATVSDDEPVAGSTSTRHPILIGAVAGGIGGCLYGAAMGTVTSDITPSGSCVVNALAFSGIVAGTVAFVNWYKDAAP